MKVAIITDQHFGARKNSKLFHDYFLKFYNDIFFPTLEKEGIDTIVDMGDTFDNRHGVNFASLSWAKNNYYDRLRDMGCTVHTIVGNHTAYYKNTNKINSIDLLLREYDNVPVYSEATEIKLGDLGVLLVPWINSENEEQTFKAMETSSSSVLMGHLELNGFKATRGYIQEDGIPLDAFEKFKKVYSGHYHTRSNYNEIYYLGNPYEMFWNDVNDDRGFHIFDTETLEHTPVNNPHSLFHIIYYEDIPYQTFDARGYENKIVKVIVRKKSDKISFEKFIDKLYSANVAELKLVENFQLIESEDLEVEESEATLSILDRYIQESETQLDKSIIQKMIKEVYQESCELM